MPSTPVFYVNTALAALVVIFLNDLNPSPSVRNVDNALGHLSYPVFLCQWLGGFLAYLAWSQASSRGWGLAFVALPIILLLSTGIAWAQHLLIEPLRTKIRSTAQRETDQSIVLTSGLLRAAGLG